MLLMILCVNQIVLFSQLNIDRFVSNLLKPPPIMSAADIFHKPV